MLLTLAGSAAAREAVRASGASLAHRASCARSWRSRCAAIIARCSRPIQSVGVAVGALSVSEGWTLGAHLVVGAVVRVGGGVGVVAMGGGKVSSTAGVVVVGAGAGSPHGGWSSSSVDNSASMEAASPWCNSRARDSENRV